ncbi:MAG TPA: riboflavin biosynthesis protein RibD, partial [Streptomyces sp.]|nr:riboflavin biosynthesis protein RibD [Streptomyces sp.]
MGGSARRAASRPVRRRRRTSTRPCRAPWDLPAPAFPTVPRGRPVVSAPKPRSPCPKRQEDPVAAPAAAEHTARERERAAMRRAVALAARGLGSTSPNPVVGCVVLDASGRVAGEGWHQRAGGPHAEVHALAEAGGAARGGTAVVTLEPCDHTGRTGPCTRALIDAGVARVLYAV